MKSQAIHTEIMVWLIMASISGLLACAAAASSGAGTKPEKAIPPEMVLRGAPPHLSLPSGGSLRSSLNISVEVEVDSAGNADMTTFKTIGSGTAENDEALRHWIEQSTFRPGHLRGQPVRGLYRTELRVRTEIVPVR